MTWKRLGEQIKRGRARRGLTQDELAARAGLSRIYIAKIEGGERTSPSLPVLEQIAKALGMRLVIELRAVRRKTKE